MAHALPIHIVSEIERRWRRRLDARPQAKADQDKDRNAGPCPICSGLVATETSIPGNDIVREFVCDGCGHVWRNEVP